MSSEPPDVLDVEPGRHFWRHGLLFAGALVLGVTVGGIGWILRNAAAEAAAAAEQVDLVSGLVVVESAGLGAGGQVDLSDPELSVPLHNAGPREVTVVSVQPDGWRLSQTPPTPTAIPPGGWVVVPLSIEPNCSARISTTFLIVLVRTDAGDYQVETPLPPGQSQLYGAYQQACFGGDVRPSFVLEDVDVRSANADSVRMTVSGVAANARSDLTVTSVQAGSVTHLAGYRAEGAGLPLTFALGDDAPGPLLEVTWTLAGCENVAQLAEAVLQINFVDADRRAYVHHARLPGEAVAALARLGAAECGVLSGQT